VNPGIVHATWQFVSGTAALIGFLFLAYYGVRLAVGLAKKRKPEPAARARILVIIATAYGLATIFGVLTLEGPSEFVVLTLWLATAVVAALRCRVWRQRLRQTQPR